MLATVNAKDKCTYPIGCLTHNRVHVHQGRIIPQETLQILGVGREMFLVFLPYFTNVLQ